MMSNVQSDLKKNKTKQRGLFRSESTSAMTCSLIFAVQLENINDGLMRSGLLFGSVLVRE